jgi:hypothetical protein
MCVQAYNHYLDAPFFMFMFYYVISSYKKQFLSVVGISRIMLMRISISYLKSTICNIKFFQKIRFVLNVLCWTT